MLINLSRRAFFRIMETRTKVHCLSTTTTAVIHMYTYMLNIHTYIYTIRISMYVTYNNAKTTKWLPLLIFARVYYQRYYETNSFVRILVVTIFCDNDTKNVLR